MLRFEGKLPRKVAMGDRRNTLIALFREYKRFAYMPSTIYSAIRWLKRDLWFEWDGDSKDGWRIVKPKTKETKLYNNTAMALKRSPPSPPRILPLAKRVKHHSTTSEQSLQVLVPVGTQWQNNSCAYDTVCTALFNV